MTLFDSIIDESGERLDLTSDQAKALISALLGLMTDSSTHGISGFSSRFRDANLGDAWSSWTRIGENAPISKEQIESALGAETIAAVSDRAGLDYATTVSALAFVLPQTIDRLTPNGAMPDEQALRAAADDLITDSDDSVPGVSVAERTASTEAFDRVGNATEDVAGKAPDMMNDASLNDSAAVGDRFSGAPAERFDQRLGENVDGEFSDDSPLKWLAPLIVVGLLVAAGFWFCGNSSAPRASIKRDSDFFSVKSTFDQSNSNAS